MVSDLSKNGLKGASENAKKYSKKVPNSWNCPQSLADSKTQIVKKNQKLKLSQKLKCEDTQIVMKLKKSTGDRTQKFKWWPDSKTEMGTYLKLWQDSNCDKTQNVTKFKLWQNLRTQIMTKLKNWSCD